MLYKQESCVLNVGFTTKHFNLEKDDRQGDLASAYLFILALEFLFFFFLIKVITAYTDDSTFFLKDLASVKKLLDTFSYYSKYSAAQPNFSNCKIDGIESLRGVEVAICGIKSVNSKLNTFSILGIPFSYNNKLNVKKKFLIAISNIQNLLKI